MRPVSSPTVSAAAKKRQNNIGYILEEAGLSFADVTKTCVLLADINDFAAMNAVYSEFFRSDCPARVCYQVAALPKAAKVEIDAIAVYTAEASDAAGE